MQITSCLTSKQAPENRMKQRHIRSHCGREVTFWRCAHISKNRAGSLPGKTSLPTPRNPPCGAESGCSTPMLRTRCWKTGTLPATSNTPSAAPSPRRRHGRYEQPTRMAPAAAMQNHAPGFGAARALGDGAIRQRTGNCSLRPPCEERRTRANECPCTVAAACHTASPQPHAARSGTPMPALLESAALHADGGRRGGPKD
jgi:hypothetical protein